ncbi:MAG: hypothetical protein GF409_02985 [Candidatus Omnitrophica bacterium]|nr:hypothetical protein [Candidatus Omnitrophota bacterium]
MKKKKNNIACILASSIMLSALAAVILMGEVYSHAEPGGFEYESHGRRDPFIPLVGVETARGRVEGLTGIMSIDDVSLQGILVGPDGSKMVIINGEMIKEGAMIGSLLVEDIGKNRVRIKIEDQVFELELYEQP